MYLDKVKSKSIKIHTKKIYNFNNKIEKNWVTWKFFHKKKLFQRQCHHNQHQQKIQLRPMLKQQWIVLYPGLKFRRSHCKQKIRIFHLKIMKIIDNFFNENQIWGSTWNKFCSFSKFNTFRNRSWFLIFKHDQNWFAHNWKNEDTKNRCMMELIDRMMKDQIPSRHWND